MEVDSRISPSLHPDNVRTSKDYDDDTKPVLGLAADVLSTAYEGLRQVHNARNKARLNPTWNEAARAIHTQDLADKMFGRIAKKMDDTRATLLKQIAFLEGELTRPIQSRAAGSISAEVRAHFKSLPTDQRQAAIMQAIREGDSTVASAVLGAPAMLSGFEPEMQQVLIRRYHERHNPVEAKRLRAAQGAADMIMQAGGLLFTEMEKAVGMPPHKVQALRKAKTEAEQAFILRDVA